MTLKSRPASQKFLSTLSLRRATTAICLAPPTPKNFYPRSPCGERLWPGLLARPFFLISIHALLAESDDSASGTLSDTSDISIHALLAESDLILHMAHLMEHLFLSTLSLRRATSQQPAGTTRTTYFYPRSPCGERLNTADQEARKRLISIHALLAESDRRGGDSVILII